MLNGNISTDEVKHMLENPYSWNKRVKTASPYGLHLVDIEFDPSDLVGASTDLQDNPVPPWKPIEHHTPIEIDWYGQGLEVKHLINIVTSPFRTRVKLLPPDKKYADKRTLTSEIKQKLYEKHKRRHQKRLQGDWSNEDEDEFLRAIKGEEVEAESRQNEGEDSRGKCL